MRYALQTVTDSGLIQSKQDFMAVHKVMCDVIYCCRLSCPAFIQQLEKYKIVFPEGHDIRPKADNIRKVKFRQGERYAYPKWHLIDGTASQLKRYKQIAANFLDAYYSLMPPS